MKNEVLMKKQMRFDHPSNFLEVERKFQQKSFQKKLVKLQHQSQAGLMQLLRWDVLNYTTYFTVIFLI